MILSLITLSLFHLGSLYISYEDMKNRSVTLWVLIVTLMMGGLNVLLIALTIDMFLPTILLLVVIISLFLIKKCQVIAWADIFYSVILLLFIQELWWVFFICIGILSIFFHYGYNKQREQPFIALLYSAFMATKLYILLQ